MLLRRHGVSLCHIEGARIERDKLLAESYVDDGLLLREESSAHKTVGYRSFETDVILVPTHVAVGTIGVPPARKDKHEPSTAYMPSADTLRGELSAALCDVYELVFVQHTTFLGIEEIARWVLLEGIR